MGNMWRFDPYDIRKFKCGDIKTFVDIGGNQGLASLTAFAAWHDDQCRILCIEPFPPTLETAKECLGGWALHMGVELHNMALGNGETLYFVGGKFHGEYRFLTQEEYDEFERAHGEESFYCDKEYLKLPVQSYLLPALMRELNVDQTKDYFLKIDCEGGERFLFDDPDAIDILSKSAQTAMEVHYMESFQPLVFAEFALHMSETHIVRVTFQQENGEHVYLTVRPEELGYIVETENTRAAQRVFKARREATFVRKDWAKKRPSNERSFVEMALERNWSSGKWLNSLNL